MKLKRTAEIAEDISDRLIEAIVTWKLPPGQPLREARLAKEWGVSRTPVREAVRQAAALGLIELRRNRAPFIRTLTSSDVTKLYALRERLEVLALELSFEAIPAKKIASLHERIVALDGGMEKDKSRRSALSLDTEVHQLWIAHCDNRWLQQAINQLWTFIRILQQIVAKDKVALRNAISEHRTILDALQAGDLPATRNALLFHIRSSSEYLKRQLPSS